MDPLITTSYIFPIKYLPLQFIPVPKHQKWRKYLEWLASVLFSLRMSFPTLVYHVYDPATDTIATLESFLITIFNRMSIEDGMKLAWTTAFEGGRQYVDMIRFNGELARYLFSQALTWPKEVSKRYVAIDPKNDTEFKTVIDALQQFMNLVVDQVRSQPEYSIPVTRPQLDPKDQIVLGIMENEVLSLLARLQYVFKIIVNPNHPIIKSVVQTIIGSDLVDKPLKEYLARFQQMMSNDTTHLFVNSMFAPSVGRQPVRKTYQYKVERLERLEPLRPRYRFPSFQYMRVVGL